MKREYFKHKAKKVNIDGITFDSKLEASLYKVLRRYRSCIEINVHSKVYTGWSIDFDLSPKCIEGVNLLGKLGRFTGKAHPTRILIEVKGITDPNFIRRYKQIIGSSLEAILILASSKSGAIGYEHPDPKVLEVITKPIVPISMIRDILQQ